MKYIVFVRVLSENTVFSTASQLVQCCLSSSTKEEFHHMYTSVQRK